MSRTCCTIAYIEREGLMQCCVMNAARESDEGSVCAQALHLAAI